MIAEWMKDDVKILKKRLKSGYKKATQGQGSGVLHSANHSLENFKTGQAHNSFWWHGVPLDNVGKMNTCTCNNFWWSAVVERSLNDID